MKRLVLAVGFAAACLLSGCTSSAAKVAIRTNSAVLWPNLCKRVTVELQTESGEPVAAGGSEVITIAATGGTVYATNYCTGAAVTSVTATEGQTTAAFFVKATELGTANFTVTDKDGKTLGEGSLDVVAPTHDLVLGQPDFTSSTANNGGRSASTISDTWFVDTCGDKLLVSDSSNNRVLIWSSMPTTNAQAADVVVGQANFTSGGDATTATTLSYPEGATCSGSKMAIADYDNTRLLLYNSIPTTNGAAADLVIGAVDLVSSGTGGPNAHTFSGLTSITGTATGLVATDDNWQRIMIWPTFPTANNQDATIVLGQPDFTTTSDGTSDSKLQSPYVARQRGEYTFVADCSNNRVLIWNNTGLASGAAAFRVVGQADFTSSVDALTAAGMSCPTSADWDGDHLIVADSSHSRLLVWNGMPAANGAPADVVLGAPNFTTAGLGTATQTTLSVNWGQISAGEGKGIWIADGALNRVTRFPAP